MPAPGPIREATRQPSATATRTRPEAQGNASRSQATNDWFRHESRAPSPPPSRPTSAIAQKNKGDPLQWYAHPHHVTGEADVRGTTPGKKKPVVRCSTDEAKQNFAKIKGTHTSWYRHDDNAGYVADRPKSRLTERSGLNNRNKISGRGSVEWYKNDEETRSSYTPTKAKTRTPTRSSESNFQKLRPTGTPVWASYDQSVNGKDAGRATPPTRLRLDDGDAVVTKNRKGHSDQWYTHDHSPERVVLSPRITSPEGVQNASRFKSESGDWFNHEANKNYIDPIKTPRCKSSLAKEMLVKNRGQEDDFLKLETNGNHASSPSTPEANGNHMMNGNGVVNGNGMVNGNGSLNGSTSPGNDTLNTAFADMSISKPASPPHKNPRMTAASEVNASKNKGTLNVLMSPSPSDEPITNGFTSPRMKSAEARQHALRDRGTVDALFHPDARR